MNNTKGRVLIIDDEKDLLRNISRILKKWDYEVIQSEDPVNLLDLLKEEKPDIVITDLRMPEIDGLEILEIVINWNNEVPVIILTGFGSVSTAVDAMKEGAYDFLTKPFELDSLSIVLNRAMERRRLFQDRNNLEIQLLENFGEKQLLVYSEEMQNVIKMAKKVAKTNSNVLITGESGTGKELLARYVHTLSLRYNKPFIPFDCTTLPENLMETELFGYEKGAYTGAVNSKQGLIELAENGTLFIDEIGDLPFNLQAKLLRLIQERQYRKVGGNKWFNADVRFVAATNQSLEEKVETKEFRADLFYRLNVVRIFLPPLRERKEEITLLATKFLKTSARENNKKIIGFTDEAKQLMELYNWPGNVRELQNVVERAAILTEE